MAHICINTSEKSEKEQIKNKIHARLLFLTVKGLSIQNLCLKDRLLVLLPWNSWKIKKELFACDQALLTIGCSITTTPLITRRSLWSNFWLKRAFLLFHSPILPWSESVRLLFVPKLKFHLKARHFGTVENIEKALTDQLKAIPVSEYQRC